MKYHTHVITTLGGGVASVLNSVATFDEGNIKSSVIVLEKSNIDNEILNNLKKMQCEVIFRPQSFLPSLLFIVRYAFDKAKYKKRVIISYDFRSNLFSWLLTIFCHAKWLPAIHGLEAAFVPWRKYLLRFIFKKCYMLVVPSYSVADKVSKSGMVHSKKIVVIYNSVNFSKVRVKNDNPKIGAMKLVCVGNFYLPLKGQHVAVEALNKLPYGCSLTFIGEGPLKENVVELVENYKLRDRVKFLGFLPNQNILDILKDFDLLLVPSLSEAFGIVAIEGMAAGLPVIASDVGGLREIVDQTSGSLFDVNDHNMLADLILKISQDDELWTRLHLGAIKRSQEFSIERMKCGYAGLMK